MTDFPEAFRDLLDTEVAALTTIGDDGVPQTSLVWFLYDADDGELKVSLNDHRHKTRNLLKRPEVSLLLRDGDWRYMDVRGHARLEPDADYAFADKVGAKYGGADLRERDNPGDSRYVVTIEPIKVYPVNMRG
jgi:PPOX class probable F420-dependent enzyme